MNRVRRTAALAAVLTLGLITAACGSSKPSPAASPATSGHSGKSTSAAKLEASARAAIKQYSAPAKFSPTGPPVDVSGLRGKTVLIVMHDTVADELVGIQKGIQQAGAAIGFHVQSYNGQGTVSTIEQGIQQGINAHVGAIVLTGVDPALVPQSVKAAEAAHIPLITASDGTRKTSSADSGIFSMVSEPYTELAELDAYTAIIDSAGKPIYAIIEKFDNPVSPNIISGITKVFSQCSYCHIVTTTDIEPTSWPTKLPSETASLIRANPKVNFIIPVVDTMALFAVSGVNQAGASKTVSVVSSDGSSEATLSLVKRGTALVTDPGGSAIWEGWQVTDEVVRAMKGMSPGNAVVPFQYLNRQNLAGVNLSNLANVYGTSYISGFEKLWGVGH